MKKDIEPASLINFSMTNLFVLTFALDLLKIQLTDLG